jgi:hypothetical protein
MYNTNFIVRYRDIENELISNLHRIEIKKQAKELALEKEKEVKALAETPAKKKGGRKKAVKVDAVTTDTKVDQVVPLVQVEAVAVTEAPKKRGRKKAIKTVSEEPITEEPVKLVEPIISVDQNTVVSETVKHDATEDEDDTEDLDLEYTIEDVHLICEKLYRDELLSVFEVDSINDPNMDTGIKRVIERMIDNVNFKQLLEDIKHEIIDTSKFTGTPTEIQNLERNSEYLIFITLFSQHVFYITHKCICQLFTVNEIDTELINQLKNKTISLFKK